MEHFGRVRAQRSSSIPMQKLVAFAIFSTRRQEEITLLHWDDLEEDRILVRDMKHPGDKGGNNVHCELPPEAIAIIEINAARETGNLPLLDRRHQRRIHTSLQNSWN